jgi:hypothetical protein
MHKCPTCGDDGDSFSGTPGQEVDRFLKRAVLALHRVRQALTRRGHVGLPDMASGIINDLEDLAELAEDWKRT